MEKFVKDGKVAVLYSPEYGAGWYTWNKEYPDMLFDPTMVHYILQDKTNEATAYAVLKWPEAYISSIEDLKIAWVPLGSKFKVVEYDGNESIELKEDDNQWLTA